MAINVASPSKIRLLADVAGIDSDPSVTPDGASVVFANIDGQDRGQLWSVRLDTPTGIAPLATTTTSDIDPDVIGDAPGAPTSPGWSRGSPMPTPREGAFGAVLGGQLYVAGGNAGLFQGDSSVLERYDPATDTWTSHSPMRSTRAEGVAVVAGGKLFAIGGRGRDASECPGANTETNAPCTSVEAYDPTTDAWTPVVPLPKPLAGLGAAVVGDTIYVVGGRSGPTPGVGQPSNDVYRLDLSTGQWADGPDIVVAGVPYPRMDIQATVATGSQLYVFGGTLGFNEPSEATVLALDTTAGEWSRVADMPTPRRNAIAGACGGGVFVIGGLGPNGATAVNERYDLRAGTWTSASPPPAPLAENAAALVSTGTQIIAAGNGPHGLADGSVYRFECAPPQLEVESATGAGIKWPGSRNWFMYTRSSKDKVDLIAAQHVDVGDIFMQRGSSGTYIEIVLHPGWSFADARDNVKIHDMQRVPKSYVAPGKFKYKFGASGVVWSGTVPNATYYGIHAEVVKSA